HFARGVRLVSNDYPKSHDRSGWTWLGCWFCARGRAPSLRHGVSARVQIDAGDRLWCSARRLHGVPTQRGGRVLEALAGGLGAPSASGGASRTRSASTEPANNGHTRSRAPDSGADMSLLEVEGVSISFGGVRALDNVSARFGAGEIVGIIGP